MKKVMVLIAIFLSYSFANDMSNKDNGKLWIMQIKSRASVRIRKEPNLESEVIGGLIKNEIVKAYAIRSENKLFYPLVEGGYVSIKYVDIIENSTTKIKTQKEIKSKLATIFGISEDSSKHTEKKVSVKQNNINITRKAKKDIAYQTKKNNSIEKVVIEEPYVYREPVKIEIQKEEPINKKSMYAYNAKIAKENRQKALVKNITKLPSPVPVMEQPKYARVLTFPHTNIKGDVYYDYSYNWIKIKQEEFILGVKENRNRASMFGINRD